MSLIPRMHVIYGDDPKAKVRADVEWFVAKPPEERRALQKRAAEHAEDARRVAARRAKFRTGDMAEGRALAARIAKRLGRNPEIFDDLTAAEMIAFRKLSPAANQEVFRAAIDAMNAAKARAEAAGPRQLRRYYVNGREVRRCWVGRG